MAPTIPKHQIGSRVSTKAILVTNLAECKRRYGANAKTKVAFGFVEEVGHRETSTGRATYSIKAGWDLGGTSVKIAFVNSQSVTLVPGKHDPQPPEPQQDEE